MSLDGYIVSVRLEAPSKRRQADFLQSARRSRSLHRPWVQAPSDALTFAAYLRRRRSATSPGWWVACSIPATGIRGPTMCRLKAYPPPRP